MSRTHTMIGLAGAAVVALVSGAAAEGLDVTLPGLTPSGAFPDTAAFCPPEGTDEANVSPELRWSAGPAGTKSYAVVMTDPDVPADLSLINKPGTTIPADAPRQTIYHWVLIDVPADRTGLPAGIEGDGVVPGGKPVGATDHGLRGANDYTGFLAGNPDMAGTYGGYDGPCPPANDALAHRYQVEVFALDVATLGLSGAFTGPDAIAEMDGHVLATGSATATFTLNPNAVAE